MCVCVRVRATSICVRENLRLHFLIFVCVCACNREGTSHTSSRVDGRLERVIKAFDKKGPHAGKFSVKYKDDPNWWTHSLLLEGYETECCVLVLDSVTSTPQGKDKHWVLLRLLSSDSA